MIRSQNTSRQKLGNFGKAALKNFGLGTIAVLVCLALGRHIIQAGKPRIDFVSTNSAATHLRGLIYDRNGYRLAYNTNSYSVSIGQLGDSEIETLKQKYTQGYAIQSNFYIPVGKEISAAINLSAELSSQYSKVEVVTAMGRSYSLPVELAALIGFVGAPTAEDVENGYQYQDLVGKQGLEAAYESRLTGTQSAEGRGEDIQLTIDAGWQKRLYDLVANQTEVTGAKAGAAAVMKADTGELMAYVSYPTFNAQQFADGITAAAYADYANNPRMPMLDKVANLQGPPGSAFKIITGSYLLQAKQIDSESRVFSTGCIYLADYPFCEYERHYLGDLEVTDALSVSSNIFFCEYLAQAVQRNGVQAYVDFAQKLGIGVAPAVEWVQATAGIMPSPEYKSKTNGENWYLGDTCNTAIGQGMVSTSPLQMLLATNTIATGGNLLKPRVLADEQPSLTGMNWDPNAVQLIHQGMHKVVNDDRGTDRWVLGFVPGPVWAKTGTAEAVYFENGEMKMGVHAWVAGFFDYNGERYSFVTHLHYGGGAWNATPIMRDFLTCMFEQTC